MKYALVIIWFVHGGQVDGRVVKEYADKSPQVTAQALCKSDLDGDRGGAGLACVPMEKDSKR